MFVLFYFSVYVPVFNLDYRLNAVLGQYLNPRSYSFVFSRVDVSQEVNREYGRFRGYRLQ